jgi:LAO/AO transport system kinase
MERLHAQRAASGQLAQRRNRQNLRWLWALVEEGLRQALYNQPAVQAIRDVLEREVQAGTSPPAVAAQRILGAFGIGLGNPKGPPGP